MRPLKLSQKPFCIGFPGAMKCQTTLLSCAQANTAFEVNSVPLSETIMPGFASRNERRAAAPRRGNTGPGKRVLSTGKLQALRQEEAAMKVRSSVRSLKNRPGSVVIKRRGKVFVINRLNPRWKARQG